MTGFSRETYSLFISGPPAGDRGNKTFAGKKNTLEPVKVSAIMKRAGGFANGE
jgi:hypothetical protein